MMPRTTVTATATATATARCSLLTPHQILQAYDAQIDERRSDRDQLQEVRACMKISHDANITKQQAYLDHLTRQMKSRIQRGGDISTYSRVMESCYKQQQRQQQQQQRQQQQQQQRQQQRPVNDIIRRQSLLLSVAHQCEVQQKSMTLVCRQNKRMAKHLRRDVSNMEREKAQVKSTFAKRLEERLLEMERSRQHILTSTIQPQRMVLARLLSLIRVARSDADTDHTGTNHYYLEEQMMQRRRRQNKGIQATLKERSENFKRMGQTSFDKAKHHRRKSFGSQSYSCSSDDDDLAESMADYLDCDDADDNKSIGSHKSGWSRKSGWSTAARSAGPGWIGGGGNFDQNTNPLRRNSLLGRFFGRASTLESETATTGATKSSPSPPALMEISIIKRMMPPSSTFLFMTGLDNELESDFPTEVTIQMVESSVDSL